MSTPSTPGTPLSALECELLEVIAQNRDEHAAFVVLADHWMEVGEVDRGEALQLELRDDITDVDPQLMYKARDWRERVVKAGFAERDLTLDRCFLERPLVIDADSGLDGDPDLVRLSPRYYRRGPEVATGWDAVVHVGEAVTPRTITRVALKIALHPDAMAILAREDLMLRRFDHPNLPRTHGFAILSYTTIPHRTSEHADELLPATHALVLDWRGKDLRSLLAAARDHDVELGRAFAISVLLQLCDAIAALHEAGMFHSEVRPDHVLVGESGIVTLIDLGFVHGDPPLPDWVEYSPYRTSPVRVDATRRLSYLSPEQGRGDVLDLRTDIFSAGLVAYRLIVGRSATAGAESGLERVQRIVQTDLVPPPGTPPAFAAFLRRALARDRGERYPSIAAFRDALVAASGGR
ncbi:MAG TPA: protein kinase, partial [Kofleriaceae bacterium]